MSHVTHINIQVLRSGYRHDKRYLVTVDREVQPQVLFFFLMGTASLYRVCSTGLRQTQGSPSLHLFKSICVFCVFLFSTPASHSPLVLYGHSALPPPRGGSASRVSTQSCQSHVSLWGTCYSHCCALRRHLLLCFLNARADDSSIHRGTYHILESTHCNTLQHTATHCNTQRYVSHTRVNTLQHTATHCNTLQHTATHCNTLQHTATHKGTYHILGST